MNIDCVFIKGVRLTSWDKGTSYSFRNPNQTKKKLNGNIQHVRAVKKSWPFVDALLLAVHFHWNTMDQLWIVDRKPRGTAERLWYLSHQTLIVTKDLLNHSSGCPPVLDHVEKALNLALLPCGKHAFHSLQSLIRLSRFHCVKIRVWQQNWGVSGWL